MSVVAFSLAALAVSRIQILSSLEQRRQARSLASSAIQAALADLRTSQTYGASGGDTPIQVPGPGSAQLVFDPGTAATLGIPPSCNNFQGLSSVVSAGSNPLPVAASTCLLQARGTYGSAVELVQATASVPTFPYALASAGSIHSTGGLVVASFGNTDTAALDTFLNDPAAYGGPANLVSNAAGAESVQIAQQAVICGDLQSSGTVDLSGAPIRVLGELRQQAPAANLPVIPTSSFNPTFLTPPPADLIQISAAPPGDPPVEGTVYCSGSYITTGSLTLNNGLLYVKGNLNVQGATTGTGSIIVEGTTQLHGSASLTAGGRVALISKGDILLDASSAPAPATGSPSSSFSGIIYTEGQLTANNLLIFGSLIGGSPGPASGAQIKLQNCVVLKDTSPVYPASTPLTATVTIFPAGAFSFGAPPPPPELFPMVIKPLTPGVYQFKVQGSSSGSSGFTQTVNTLDNQSVLVLQANLQSLAGSTTEPSISIDNGANPKINCFFQGPAPPATYFNNLNNLFTTPQKALFDLSQFLIFGQKMQLSSYRLSHLISP
jgi:hypothetical protein